MASIAQRDLEEFAPGECLLKDRAECCRQHVFERLLLDGSGHLCTNFANTFFQEVS